MLLGCKLKTSFPTKRYSHISAEKFTQQYIESVKKNTRNDFIHFYQIIDVLIIDDVQFFSGKSGTQDVFFHIFNHLHQNGKQVILTSDKAPVDMQDIEQRLLSRFKWGLSAELQQPNYETRISILKNKLYRDGVVIDDDIIEYVAKNIKSNIRELEGAIISLIAQSSFNKMDVTIDLAKEIVDKFVKNTKREVSIDYIQKVVSEYFQMDVETLQSKHENVTLFKPVNWPCISPKNSPKPPWPVLEVKLVSVTTLLYSTLARPLTTFLLRTNNSENTLTISTRN